jgi:chromate reductase
VAVIGASTCSFGAVWAQAELRKALGLARARVLDHELAIPTAHEAFADDGRLAQAAARRRLGEILEHLVAGAHGGPSAPDVR